MNTPGFIQNEALRAALEAWATTNLTAVNLSLYVNDIPADSNAPATDYVEAAFSGYAAVAVSPSGAADIGSQTISQSLTNAFFQADADPDPGEMVYGWFILDGAGGVFAAGRLATPKAIIAINDFVNVTPSVDVQLPPA